jgi:hypothetical protein
MMNQLVRKLKEPWDFIRILRVLFGGYIVGAGLFDAQYFGIFIGGFLLYQGLMNIGCFGAACVASTGQKNAEETDIIRYEELKSQLNQ